MGDTKLVERDSMKINLNKSSERRENLPVYPASCEYTGLYSQEGHKVLKLGPRAQISFCSKKLYSATKKGHFP